MPQAKLSNSFIKTIGKPTNRTDYFDTELKGLVLRASPSGLKTYQLIYRNANSQLKRYKIDNYGSITLNEARVIAQEKLADIARGIDIQTEKKTKKQEIQKSITFGEYKDFYLEWYEANRKVASSAKSVFNVHFTEFNSFKLDQIDHQLIHKWVMKQKKNGHINTSINRRLNLLKSCISRAVDFGYLDKNNLAGFKRLKVDTSPNVRYLSENEETSLNQALLKFPQYIQAIVSVAINTGMRRGEIFNLEWQDIDFFTKTITIQGGTSKSGHTRQIPMNNACYATLKNWESSNICEGIVFKSPKTGRRLDDIKGSIKTLFKQAEILNFRFHDLRHTFASKLVMKGVDLNTVRELLGHSDLTMTLRYAHLAPEHKRKAVELL
ncbi:tyrosine-type recombinase/integrase [Francisellaceae bacterium]|nr:tyrosine-type recombinase/integrase [Francisellaceae bacterium]